MSPSPQDTTIALAGLQLVECPKCMRVRLDRDHGFQSIVIINSRAS